MGNGLFSEEFHTYKMTRIIYGWRYSLQQGIFILKDGFPISMFYNPKEVSESRSVNYAKHQPLNVSHPVYHYVNGGEETLNFTMLVKSNVKIINANVEIPVELYLESIADLTYPYFEGNVMKAGPPVITFVFGAMVKDIIISSLEIKKDFWDRFLRLKVSHITINSLVVVKKSKNRLNYIKGSL